MNHFAAMAILATTTLTAAAAAVITLPAVGSTATAWSPSLTRNAHDTFSRGVAPGWGTASQGSTADNAGVIVFRLATADGRIAAPAADTTVLDAPHSFSPAAQLGRLAVVLRTVPTLPTATREQYVTLRTRQRPHRPRADRQLLGEARSGQQRTGTTAAAFGRHGIVPGTASAEERINLNLRNRHVGNAAARPVPGGHDRPPAGPAAGTETATGPTAPGTIAVSLYTSSSTKSGVPTYPADPSGWALTPATTPTSSRPGPTNTGVPAGTHLTVHTGDLNITTSGRVISGLDIHGNVNIAAPNVVLKNSIVRGGGFHRWHLRQVMADRGMLPPPT